MGTKNTRKTLNSTTTSNSKKIEEQTQIHIEKVNKNSFEYLQIIGKGGFGKVWKVYHKQKKMKYALKEMNKTKILDKKSEKSVIYERILLSKMNHPFIINMHYSFQDKENLYIVMDLLTGGDLRYHLCKQKKFDEEQTTCLLLGLEYVHKNNIIHRDIKPENLVLDSKGYVKITDFGIAKIYQKENSTDTSGTPGYMSPEVLCCQNHTFATDYFAVGVIGYEFMTGKRPYLGKNRKEIKDKIMSKQVRIKKNDMAQNWSIESADCINRLLERKPCNRLGFRGATEVKEHSWFKYYSWKDLYLGKLNSPFVPKIGDNFDHKYCNKPEHIGIDTQERYYKIINGHNYKSIFKEFYYFDRDYEEKEKNDSYCKKKFINPHILMYYDENEESTDTNDAAVINRNIFSNNSNEDEVYSEIKKNYVGPFMLYNLFNNNNNNHHHYAIKKGNRTTLSLMTTKGNYYKNDINNMNNSFKNLSFSNRKKNNNKTSGYGY